MLSSTCTAYTTCPGSPFRTLCDISSRRSGISCAWEMIWVKRTTLWWMLLHPFQIGLVVTSTRHQSIKMFSQDKWNSASFEIFQNLFRFQSLFRFTLLIVYFIHWNIISFMYWGRCILKYYIIQWRIQDFPEGGANSESPIILQIFCRKLHENERIWTPTGEAPML